jgi:hypothetical protein
MSSWTGFSEETAAIKEVNLEIERFQKKMEAFKLRMAKELLEKRPSYTIKERGAIKRAALDLRESLLLITKL